jgi:DUF971 family protein
MPYQLPITTIRNDGDERLQDGVVVWDQKGIVVAWADGHRSRFPWDFLRRSCLCPDCLEQNIRQDAAPRRRKWGVA